LNGGGLRSRECRPAETRLSSTLKPRRSSDLDGGAARPLGGLSRRMGGLAREPVGYTNEQMHTKQTGDEVQVPTSITGGSFIDNVVISYTSTLSSKFVFFHEPILFIYYFPFLITESYISYHYKRWSFTIVRHGTVVFISSLAFFVCIAVCIGLWIQPRVDAVLTPS
jgi:hypothetical protein